MKKLLLVAASFIVLNVTAQNIGIGTTTPQSKLSVGNSSQFQIDSIGNIKKINNIPYDFPSTQGSNGQVLTNNGSGLLLWESLSSYVPYNGAIGAVNLGANDLTVNGLTLGLGGGSVATNTATGFQALTSNTTGTNNNATGYQALYSNTTGNFNIANGSTALYSNTDGSQNTATGFQALTSNTTGTNNNATGFQALYSNTEGSSNIATGSDALLLNTTGNNNIATGILSLFFNTTGNFNTATGDAALHNNTTGSKNTAIGSGADVASGALTNASAIGAEAVVAVSNTIQLGNTAVTNVKTSGTITAGAVTYPKTHGTSGQVLSTTGSGALSWTTPASISVGTISDSSNANAATITSGILSLTPADVTNGGIVTTGTQTFAGNKTVNGNFTISKFLSGTTLDKSITTPSMQSGAYTTCWQSFTAGASGFLSKVSMDFKNCAGTGTLFIYGGQGNRGTVLTSQSFSVSTIGNEIFQDFLLNSPVYVTNGNEYTMAFVCSSGTINEVVSTNFYPGSQYLYYNGSNWPSTPSGGSSILFKTYLSQESGGNITAAKSITAGAVTYPNAHGTSGQVLSTSGSGTLSWITPSTTATAYSGTLPVANGGTGTTTSTGTGNVVLSSSPTLVSPALGTPSSGVATYLTGLPLTTGVTGILPIANGGTGAITKSAAFDSLSPMTTPGDMIYGGTLGKGTRLGKGADGQVLTLASGIPSWTTPSSSLTIGTIAGSSNANAATLTSGVLSLTPADSTNGGIITTGTQTFAGNKTVNGNFTVVSGSASIDVNNTSGAMTGTVGSTQWQSFVAGQTGVLTKIAIIGNGSAGIRTGTLTIFAGSGLGGTQLSTQSVVLPPNNGLFDLVLSSTVNIVQAQTYTFEIIDPSGGNFIGSATALSGTSYYSNSYGLNPGWSLAFNTWVIPSNRIGNNITAGGTITAGAVTYPNAHGTSGQVLSTTGSGTLSWVNPQSGPTGAQGPQGATGATGPQGATGATGSISALAIIGSVPNANGATLTSGVLNLQPADGTNGGVVTNGTQTFAGAKTFNMDLHVNGITVGMGAGSVASNTATGYNALISNTSGSYNTANGSYALRSNTTGSLNTANGSFALYSNTDGTTNTANGEYALGSNTTGGANTASGYQTLFSNTTGGSNTAFGYQALNNNTTGGSNTAIGCGANAASGTLTNATAIGNGAVVAASYSVRIGNTSVTSIGGQVGWTSLSDGRMKENVKEEVPGLSFINSLRPVTYTLNTKKFDNFILQQMPDSVKAKRMQTEEAYSTSSNVLHTGFIAQEVEAAAKKVGFNFDGVDAPKNEHDLYGLRYAEFVVPLVKSVQELSVENIQLKSDIATLKKQMEELTTLIKTNK